MSSQGGSFDSSPSSGAGVEPISGPLREFISSKVSRCVSEILDEHLGAICTEVVAIVGACTSSPYEQEIGLEHLGKRGLHPLQAGEGPWKRPNVLDHRLRGRQG